MKRHRFAIVLMLAALVLSFIGCQQEVSVTGNVNVSLSIEGCDGYTKAVVWGQDASGKASAESLVLLPDETSGVLTLPAGEWTLQASVMKGNEEIASSSVKVKVIPNTTVNSLIQLKGNVKPDVPASRVTMDITDTSYVGDSIWFTLSRSFDFDVSLEMDLGPHHISSVVPAYCKNDYVPIEGIAAGTYECTIKLYKGDVEIPTIGNSKTIKVKEYTLPTISLSSDTTVYVGDLLTIKLSEALPVAITSSVYCGDVSCGFAYFSPGETIAYIKMPSEIAVGSHTLRFECFYNNQSVEIDPIDITVEEFKETEITLAAPKYFNSVFHSINLNCEAYKDIEIRFDLSIEENQFQETLYKQVGESFVNLYLDRLERGTYTITGTAEMLGKTIDITPITFTNAGPDVGCFVTADNQTFLPGKVTHDLRSILYDGNLSEFENCTVKTYITDSDGFKKIIEWGNANQEIEYSGKDVRLLAMTEVRDSNGNLLLSNADPIENFAVVINGPDHIVIPESGFAEASYSVELNRDDLDIRIEYEIDNCELDITQPISWTKKDVGKHEVQVFYVYNGYYYLTAWKEITVTEEHLDSTVDFDIKAINRSPRNPREFEVYIESSRDFLPDDVSLFVAMNGESIPADVYFYNLDYAYFHRCAITLPDDVEPLGTLKVDAILLDDKGTTIQKCSNVHEAKDFYVSCWEDYSLGILNHIDFELVGAEASEKFDFYDGDKKLDLPGKNGFFSDRKKTGFMNLETIGFGEHSIVAVSQTDPSRKSEAFSWYGGTDIDIDCDDLAAAPGPSMNCRIIFAKNPADNLPETATYSLWYQYEGHDKVVCEPNDTGEFVINTDVMDGFDCTVCYSVECGGHTYSYGEYYINTFNCQIGGLPTEYDKGGTKEFDLTLNWYEDKLTYENYNYEWRFDGETIGYGRNFKAKLPLDSDSVTVHCKISKKSDPSNWILIQWRMNARKTV